MSTPLTELQLDALRELANIASGNAATALSAMLGREIEISVPRALALPLGEAAAAAGPVDEAATGVVIPISGDITGVVLMLFPLPDAVVLCDLLGVLPGTDFGNSALSEIGNILGTSYIGALAAITGLELDPSPPQLACDLLGAIVQSLLAALSGQADTALIMDSDMYVAGSPCALTFMLLPAFGGVENLLTPLGLGSPS